MKHVFSLLNVSPEAVPWVAVIFPVEARHYKPPVEFWRKFAKTGWERVLAKMTTTSFRRLQKLQRRLQDIQTRAVGAPDFTSCMSLVREAFRERGLVAATFIHSEAKRIYPIAEPDTIPLDRLDDVLALIDTPEKADSILANLPEDFVPQIEAFFRFMLSQFLPDQREAMLQTAKQLPVRPAGGRPSLIPAESECREICSQIAALIEGGVSIGSAQRRISVKSGKKLRTIQRIWQRRKAIEEPET
jgi:hypothetical protein